MLSIKQDLLGVVTPSCITSVYIVSSWGKFSSRWINYSDIEFTQGSTTVKHKIEGESLIDTIEKTLTFLKSLQNEQTHDSRSNTLID